MGAGGAQPNPLQIMAGVAEFVNPGYREALLGFIQTVQNRGVGNFDVVENRALGVITNTSRALVSYQFRAPVVITHISVTEAADIGTRLLKFGMDLAVNGRAILPYGAVIQGAASGSTTLTDLTYMPIGLLDPVLPGGFQLMQFIKASSGTIGTFDVGITNLSGGSTTNLHLTVAGYRLAPEWLEM